MLLAFNILLNKLSTPLNKRHFSLNFRSFSTIQQTQQNFYTLFRACVL